MVKLETMQLLPEFSRREIARINWIFCCPDFPIFLKHFFHRYDIFSLVLGLKKKASFIVRKMNKLNRLTYLAMFSILGNYIVSPVCLKGTVA